MRGWTLASTAEREAGGLINIVIEIEGRWRSN
jgi:hypothetical protein